ncbi:MAG TPA: PAC2 family protein [candidate division Zixibacteria bacterium]|nr:PAC2 family protein [candidate division Zixibacteria bacterium]
MDLQFIVDGNKNFKDHTLISGFHGIGTAGFITMKYIIDQLEAIKIGTVISEFLPPFITTKDGKLSLPFELYQENENVFLIPQFQPYRHEHRTFAEKLVDWSIQSKFNQTILVGGLDARLKKNENDKIRIVATTAYLEKHNNKLPVLEDGLFVTGPLALILTFYEIKNYPAIAVLPYAESSRADPLAAAAAVETINKITNLNINVSKLIQDAELIEQNLQEIITQTKDHEIEDKEHGTKRLFI